MTKRQSNPRAKTHCTITQVAALLGFRYQRTRDLLLTGVCGAPEYEGHHLYVRRRAVRAYLKRLQRAAEKHPR